MTGILKKEVAKTIKMALNVDPEFGESLLRLTQARDKSFDLDAELKGVKIDALPKRKEIDIPKGWIKADSVDTRKMQEEAIAEKKNEEKQVAAVNYTKAPPPILKEEIENAIIVEDVEALAMKDMIEEGEVELGTLTDDMVFVHFGGTEQLREHLIGRGIDANGLNADNLLIAFRGLYN